MKTKMITNLAACLLCGFSFLIITPQAKAQDEKAKPRLSVDYKKTMGKPGYLFINAKYKDDKTYLPATDLELGVYRVWTEDSLNLVGKVTTDAEGNAEYSLIDLSAVTADSAMVYEYEVQVKRNDRFKKASKGVKIMDSFITAEAFVEDSATYIKAQLLDASGTPISGEDVSVKVKRLFAPLKIGDYETDDDGMILVELEEAIPSKTGDLVFEVVFEKSKYGTVKAEFESNLGKSMEDLSTFDKRTMWSPPGKTPLFLLVFANLLIFGIWIVIFILVRNLLKISKL